MAGRKQIKSRSVQDSSRFLPLTAAAYCIANLFTWCCACTQSGHNPSKTQEIQGRDKVHLMRRDRAIYGSEEQRQMVVADKGTWESDWSSVGKGSHQSGSRQEDEN